MRTVLATDASIFMPTKTAAWAFACDVGGDWHEGAGIIVGEVSSSSLAELIAVHRALATMRKRGLFDHYRDIDLWCDNETVVGWLNEDYRVKDRDARPYIDRIAMLCEIDNLDIACRHIQGHTSPKKFKGLHYDLNRRADKLCGPIARAEHEFRCAAIGADPKGIFRTGRKARP